MNNAIKLTILLLSLFASLVCSASSSRLDIAREHEDMSVKVLGGSVRIVRDYRGGGIWEWNKRWEPAVVDSALSMKRGNNDYRYSHVENEKLIYLDQFGNRFLTDPWSWRNNAPQVNVTWQDRNGNSIIYGTLNPKAPSFAGISSRYGRAASFPSHYYDKNGVTVYLIYNAEGRVASIKDHHGNVVVTYEWTGNLLTAITDYSGRKVSYKYEQNKLTEFIDVNGNSWKYSYSAKPEFIQQITPEGHISTYDGETGISNNAGNIQTAKIEKEKGTDLLYTIKTESSGLVTETWRNDLGVVKEMLNGELSYTAEYKLSDPKDSLIDIPGRYSKYAIEFLYEGFPFDAGAGYEYCQMTGGWGIVETHVNDRDRGDAAEFAGCSFEEKRCKQVCDGNFCYDDCDYPPSGTSLTEHLPNALEPIPYVKQKIRTDARGNKTIHEYDRWNNEVKVIYADGTSISRTWHDKYNLPLTETNEKGIVTAYEYDEKGNLLKFIEAKGTVDERTTSYTYDEYGQVKTETTGESAAGNTALATTHYEYDQYGNITKVTNPEGNITYYRDYNVIGNAQTVIDARASLLTGAAQYAWKNTYDAAGNVLTHRNPYNKGETYTFNKTGDIASITSASGSKVTLTTNAIGQPLTMTDDNGKITKIEYDKGGRLAFTTDANGNKTQNIYDALGNLSRTVDGEGNTTQYNYTGNLLKSIQSPGHKELREYDNRNRVKQTTQQANSRNYIHKRGYDPLGNIASSVDAQENATAYEYDDLNRVKKITDAEGGITEFFYDARDNLLQVKDPEGRLTIYSYDKNDNLLSETKDGNQNTNRQRFYAYDQNGNLISSVNPEQEKTTYEFDQANQLVKTQVYAHKDHTHPIKVTNYNFNEKNHLIGWSQQASSSLPEGVSATADVIPLSETYTYNNLELLESVAVNFGNFTKTYSYTYYPNGLKKTYTNPESITYTYYYNKNNQLMAVHIPGEGQISWANFDWMVPQTLLLPGGQKVSLKYDDFQQLQESVLKKADSSELAKAVYEYDLAQNIKKIQKGEGTFNYSYDNLYRLTIADSPEGYAANDETFDYDGVGNRVSHTANGKSESQSYNQKNQLQGIDSSDNSLDTTYTYNANGHTKTQIKNGVETEYLYNHEERLIAVKRSGNKIAEYAYNPHGQRIKKTAAGITTWYFYAGNGLAAEYSSSGALIKEYHFNPAATWMTDPLFQRTAAGELYYYHNDHLGTPQQLLDGSGNIVWSAQYSAFGKAHVTVNTVENNLRLPGQYFDAETGLHQNFMRDYDVDTGRYLQEDPLGVYSSINYYAYAAQNPLSFTDPTGEIIPLLFAYARCVAQCMAMDAAMNLLFPDPCYTVENSAKQCALECLNPLNWIKGGGSGKPPVMPLKNGGMNTHTASGEQFGAYTITYSNGMKYYGKGPYSRAVQSNKQHGNGNGKIDWNPSKNEREAYKDESKLMDQDPDRHKDGANYNVNASPGDRYREEDGENVPWAQKNPNGGSNFAPGGGAGSRPGGKGGNNEPCCEP